MCMRVCTCEHAHKYLCVLPGLPVCAEPSQHIDLVAQVLHGGSGRAGYIFDLPSEKTVSFLQSSLKNGQIWGLVKGCKVGDVKTSLWKGKGAAGTAS